MQSQDSKPLAWSDTGGNAIQPSSPPSSQDTAQDIVLYAQSFTELKARSLTVTNRGGALYVDCFCVVTQSMVPVTKTSSSAPGSTSASTPPATRPGAPTDQAATPPISTASARSSYGITATSVSPIIETVSSLLL